MAPSALITFQGIGAALTVARRGAVVGVSALQRRMLVSLEINNKDSAYDWFLAWMAHQRQLSTRDTWTRSHRLSVETTIERRKNGSSLAAFQLVAGPGIHYFRYRGAWMQVCQHKKTKSSKYPGLIHSVPDEA
jgi:chaperone BCS1